MPSETVRAAASEQRLTELTRQRSAEERALRQAAERSALVDARETAAAAEELRAVQRSIEVAAGGHCQRRALDAGWVETVSIKLVVAGSGECGVGWRDENGRRFVGGVLHKALRTKRDLVRYLQTHVDDRAFRKQHKLNGNEQAVVKSSSRAALQRALLEFLDAHGRGLDRLQPGMQLLSLNGEDVSCGVAEPYFKWCNVWHKMHGCSVVATFGHAWSKDLPGRARRCVEWGAADAPLRAAQRRLALAASEPLLDCDEAVSARIGQLATRYSALYAAAAAARRAMPRPHQGDEQRLSGRPHEAETPNEAERLSMRWQQWRTSEKELEAVIPSNRNCSAWPTWKDQHGHVQLAQHRAAEPPAPGVGQAMRAFGLQLRGQYDFAAAAAGTSRPRSDSMRAELLQLSQ
eukprot:SAG22_NODE_1454_length_4388_cov_65.736302_2_plen_405_part_00